MSWVTQRFLIHQENKSVDYAFGLETQSAVLGDYGGFYCFGVHGRTGIALNPVTFWAGGSLATGGGAGAPDGDGLMYRVQAHVDVALSSRLQGGLGWTTLDFPSGNIYSNHFVYSLQYRMPYDWKPNEKAALFPGSISVLAGVLILDSRDASRVSGRQYSIYNGVRFSQTLCSALDVDLQLGASVLGATDGFMDYKAGVTMLPFKGKVRPFLRGQLGSGGGGSVHTGGGIAYLAGAGLRVGEHLELSSTLWDATTAGMQAPFLEVAYRVPFTSNFGFISNPHATLAELLALKKQTLILVIGNRTNLANGIDRNGLSYKPMSSIFLGGKVPLSKNFYVAGETLWAATGGYGAYAEGMFGVYYDVFTQAQSASGWNASIVAAGGGGIDVGSGAALAVGAHHKFELFKVPTAIVARYKYFGQEAYNPWVVGLQFEPSFTIFKR